jgi:hypothetical protein
MKLIPLKDNLLKNGKIVRWPKKTVDKNSVLEYIAARIAHDKIFTEKEINKIIIENILFDDHALIRRELIENGYLNRTKDCREYYRTKNKFNSADNVAEGEDNGFK